MLSDISVTVPALSALAVLGRNGTGKTTLLSSIIGHTRQRAGTVWLNGRDITGLRPDQRAQAGIGWVPQERGIFNSLTVVENLTAVARDGAWTPERVFQTFPRLGERKGNFGNQCRVASSRCWRSDARWWSIPACCCSMSRSKGWRR